MKVLIIEDEPALATAIGQYLRQEAFVCEVAGSFQEALYKTRNFDYDCILVDITLPGGNGLDIVRSLKEQGSNAGIIIISARNAVDDKIAGLQTGSDDYLAKPFHLSELNARIKALIRRRQFGGDAEIQFKEICLDPQASSVSVNQRPLLLTRSEYRLLVYLLANQNRVLSKESIAEHLAGDHAELMDNFDFIYSHIKNLRKKLMAAGTPDYIQAVYGIGYKFSDR